MAEEPTAGRMEWRGGPEKSEELSEMTTVLEERGRRQEQQYGDCWQQELQKVLKFSGVAPRRHIREPRSVHGQLEES